jgi:uncharacterized membrane protein YfcA
MELALGFIIAFVIAITGVGAGTITAPLLILFLHVPIVIGVGTALAYSVVVKAVVVPLQMWRRQVVYRVLGIMLLGGLPGVVLGSLLFHHFAAAGNNAVLYAVLGVIIITTSVWHLYRHFRPFTAAADKPTRRRTIAALMFPIGAEVGFSSSGAGALGTIVLLGLSSLTAAQVVGTDLAFGLCVALAGSSLHFASGNLDTALLTRLVIGGIAGGLAGSLVAPRVPNRQLRLALSICLLALGVQFCYQAVVKQNGPRNLPTQAATAQPKTIVFAKRQTAPTLESTPK